MTRPSWDSYFMSMARAAAQRSTCPRLTVGCVLVVDGDPVATGYNGAESGAAHCLDVGCEMPHGSCIRAVHAEANAVARAARRGARTDGATAYVTHSPCRACFKLLQNAGVARIVYGVPYRSTDHLDRTICSHLEEP